MSDQITITIPWRHHHHADQCAHLLDVTVELFEGTDIWSGHEWVSWSIQDECGDIWARGTAPTVTEAKTVVASLIRDRWNAHA